MRLAQPRSAGRARQEESHSRASARKDGSLALGRFGVHPEGVSSRPPTTRASGLAVRAHRLHSRETPCAFFAPGGGRVAVAGAGRHGS
jgi:hypothetical protein